MATKVAIAVEAKAKVVAFEVVMDQHVMGEVLCKQDHGLCWKEWDPPLEGLQERHHWY